MSKKFKSISAVFMAICMAVTMSSTSLFMVVADAIEESEVEEAQEVVEVPDESKEESQQDSNSLGWYDSEKDTFTISTEDDLVLLSRIANGTAEDAGGNKVQDSFKGKTIILNQSLDLSNVDIDPIGTKDLPFEGTFNGKDNSIKLNISSEKSNQALFAYNKGTIKNLVLLGYVKGKEYVAGLVSVNEGKVQDIESNVIVSATNDYAGGIIAQNDGTVTRCKNNGKVSSFRFTGGIIGINSANVTKCENTATITCTGNDTSYSSCKGTAGITGVSKGTQEKPFKISDCNNSGKIEAGYTGGGITGWVQNGQVINCYNTGYCEGAWNVGGIAGGVMEYNKNTDYSVVENCYNFGDVHIDKNVTNNAGAGGRYEFQYAGGIAGFAQNGHILNSYNAGEAYATMQAGGILGGNYNFTATVVQNCLTTKKGSGGNYIGDVVGWWNTSAKDQCTGNKYYEPTEENFAQIVSTLNAQVTDENGYYGWKYEDGKVSQARVYDVKFKVNPEDAKIVIKNSEGVELSPVEENIYMVPNGDYTYEISKDGYKTKSRSFTIQNSDESYIVKLVASDLLWTGDEDTSWYNTEDNTFEISSAAQLAGLLKLVNEGNNFEGKTIKLTKDLNLDDREWAGIGTSENQFAGTFDGTGYSISNVNSVVFKYIGQNGKVINLGVLENGSLADTNAGTVANCYNISNNSLVLNNAGRVTNCYTASSNAVVKDGTEATDSYYVDGTTYTKKDLSNGKIAGLLNKNVTQANKEYMAWAVVDKETVNQKSYIASFDLTSNSGKVTDANITLYDSEGNEINASSSKNFMLEDGTFRLVNGQYKYKIAADRYEVKMGLLKVAGQNVTVSEKLTDAYQVLFNIKPEDATLTVKDSEGNVLEPSQGTKYFLSDGNYTYEVKKTGYEAQTAEFEVKGGDLSFDVELQNVYNVSFAPNVSNARDFKIEVYKDGKLIEPQEDGTYLLTNGKYTYKAYARGYSEVTNEFEVASNELVITVEFIAPYDISWYDATKTEFEISTAEQLAGLGAIVDGYTDISNQFNGKTITLTQDINVDETLSEWLPIGTKSKSFQGVFDGANHTITVKINAPNDDNVGLFGYLSSNGSVKNVTVDGSVVGKDAVGAVVGYQNFCKGIQNCINKATVTGQNQVGGIVGNQYVYNQYIENCVNKGEVKGNTSVGGICGYMSQGCAKNCSNEADVTAEVQAGGAVGTIQGSSDVLNMKNSGDVTSNSDYAGGITGKDTNSYVTIINSYNTGNVKGANYVGGISGQTNSSKLANNYNTGDVTGTGNYIGGIVGLNAYSTTSSVNTVKNCYNIGTISASEASTNVGVIAGKANVDNCYYIDTFTSYIENQGTALAKEDFENGNAASKLNDNLSLNYKTWGVKDNTTTFTEESIQIVFNNVYESDTRDKISDYTVEVKDSEGNEVKPFKEGSYAYCGLKQNETYTYTVNAKTCEPKIGTFTYTGENKEISVGLSYIKTTTTLNINVENSNITLYNSKNSEVSPNEDGTYSLAPGEYTYKILADGYPMLKDKFTIDIVEKDEPKEINIELTKGYDVEFTSNSTTDQNVEVKDSLDNLIETSTPSKYNLNPGKYTYTLKADGYETVQGEFEVVDKDLGTISVELKKVYDLSWYDADNTEYTINTKEELLGFNAILNSKTTSVQGSNFSGKTIKLGKDIVLNSDDKFTKDNDGKTTVSEDAAVWSVGGQFAGTFDGNEHAIKGLYLGSSYSQALFQSNNGTVKNLTITGYLTGGYLGSIAVYNYGTIDNCTNKATIESTGSYSDTGGIVSQNQSNATIINCTNLGEVKGYRYVGGIAGTGDGKLNNNANKAAVSAMGSNSSMIGGIAGYVSSGSEISNNYNLGDVIGSSKIGGIIGVVNSSGNTIKNNVNYGNINASSEVGALIGSIYSDDVTTSDLANNFYQKGTATGAINGKDVEDKAEAKSSKELADGSVATLLNSAITDENGYKSWAVIDGKTVFGSCDLSITASVQGATVKLYDYKGNEIKAISGTTGVYDGLRKGSLYKYEVTKEGLNTETGTVIMGNEPQTIYVELSATVYVTVSKDGEFKLANDDETKLTRIPITATNFDVTDYGYPSVYNSDDYPTLLNVFIKFHELYAGGAENFSGTSNNSPATGNDLFITKFLGVETTQLCYYVNNKYPGEWLEEEGYIWGSAVDYIKMKNNDDVNVTMFTNYETPMFYTYFDKQEDTVKQGQNLELTLNGFDNSQAYLIPEGQAISGATIYIDGEATDIVTDEDGKATLMFDEPGTYIVSAQGTDLSLSDSEETVITAPVCEVTVTEADDITVSFDADNGEDVISKITKPGKVFNYMPTAPTKEGYTFVGWYKDTDDTTTEYKQGTRYTESVTYKAKWAHVTMLGAQGKLVVDGKSGIRFGTKLYNDGDEIVEKGTLIIPANLLAEGEALTLDTPKVARSIGKTNYEVNKEQNYVTYLGTISNIPEAQFEREMTAAAYVTYKDKAGNEYTVYSQYQNGSISVLDLLGNNIDWNGKW